MAPFKRLQDFWRRRSLRFWLAAGMLTTYCPIFISAVAGFLHYRHDIIKPLVEVASKQRDVLLPLQSLQLSLGDIESSLVDYVVDGEAQRVAAYRESADKVTRAFTSLEAAARGHALEVRDISRAHQDWREATALSEELLSRGPLNVQPETAHRVELLEASLNQLGHQLETVFEDIRVENERTHSRAIVELRRAERLAAAGFIGSIICAALGVVVINRSLVSSMDTLSMGALRLARGDRDHQVNVRIPHELASVADAFNEMTTRIVQQEDALAKAAKTDGLTGLLNRRECDRILAEEINGADQSGTRVGLIILDVDHFKSFNDTYGHQAGDEVLCAVANALMENTREVDKVCRYGGEEFVVIFPRCDAQALRGNAERLRTAIESLDIHLDERGAVPVTVSLGAATYPLCGADPESLLRNADAALYSSKENGRNQVTMANSLSEQPELATSSHTTAWS